MRSPKIPAQIPAPYPATSPGAQFQSNAGPYNFGPLPGIYTSTRGTSSLAPTGQKRKAIGG